MAIDTLCFDEVCADDPLIQGSEYVKVPVDMLPELKGADFWWNMRPQSGQLVLSGFETLPLGIHHHIVSLRVNPPPSSSAAPLVEEGISSTQSDRVSHPRLKLRLKLNRNAQDPPPAPIQAATGGKDGKSTCQKVCGDTY